MEQTAPELEKRLTELQSQINRLSLSLHLWQERQDRLFEQRLTDWNVVEARVQKDASARLEELQRTIEQEWSELRESHNGHNGREAVDQFQQLQVNLGGRLTELSEQVHAAVAEIRSLATERTRTLQPTPPSWPLDDVVRLHHQLREGDNGHASVEQGLVPTTTALHLAPAPPEMASRLDKLEQALNEGQTQMQQAAVRSSRTTRLWWAALATLAASVIVAGILVGRLQSQVTVASARVNQAEQSAQAATKMATEQVAAARLESAQLIAEARDAAVRAQTMADVLSASDLIRYNLSGGDPAAPFSAQVLWSRSRGLVFSASRLPRPPTDSTYQIWLYSTEAGPISAGTFAPDNNGRFSMATASPPRVPPPFTGVSVTVERAGGNDRPSGRALLSRFAGNP